MTWTVLRHTGTVFARMSLSRNWSDFFFPAVGGSRPQEAKHYFPNTLSRMQDSPLLTLRLSTWPGQCFSGFFTMRLLVPPFHGPLWKEVGMCSAHIGSGESCCPPEAQYPHKLSVIPLHRAFVSSPAYVCMYVCRHARI